MHYEINWARGFSVHNEILDWRYREFDVSAHSYSGNRRFWNTSSLKEYAERIDTGNLLPG
jgi:coproporphyrinogen III oxidase-like Fe-S oxidoreductase